MLASCSCPTASDLAFFGGRPLPPSQGAPQAPAPIPAPPPPAPPPAPRADPLSLDGLARLNVKILGVDIPVWALLLGVVGVIALTSGKGGRR